MRAIFLATFFMALGAGCAGDEAAKAPEEPVADQSSSMVPDAPGGDTGEGAAVPAGQGEANGQAAATAEKSQPNVAAAKKEDGVEVVQGEMTCTADRVNVRKGPGPSHQAYRQLSKGDKVEVSTCRKGWCALGDEAFVARRYLKR